MTPESNQNQELPDTSSRRNQLANPSAGIPSLDLGLREGRIIEMNADEALAVVGNRMYQYWTKKEVIDAATEKNSDFDFRTVLQEDHQLILNQLKALERDCGTTGPSAFISVLRSAPEYLTPHLAAIAQATHEFLTSGGTIGRLDVLGDGLERFPRTATGDNLEQYLSAFVALGVKLHPDRFETVHIAQEAIIQRTHETSYRFFVELADFVERARAGSTERTAFRVIREALAHDWCPATCFSFAINREPKTPRSMAYVGRQLSQSTAQFRDEQIPITLEYERKLDFIFSPNDLDEARALSASVDKKANTLRSALDRLASARTETPDGEGPRTALLQRMQFYANTGVSPAKAIQEFVADVKLAYKTTAADEAVLKLLYPRNRGQSIIAKASEVLSEGGGYGSDQHPVPLDDKETYNRYFSQTAKVYRGILDDHHGFAALTHTARQHTPGEHSDLARIGIDLAERTSYIHASSPVVFPGRGVLIEGMDPARFLSTVSEGDNPFIEHTNANPWLTNAIETMPLCTQVFLRGCMAIIPPADTEDSRFTIELENGRREPYAYIVFNDHFHNFGHHKGFLVPAILLRSKLSQTTIPTDLWEEGQRSAPRDINEQDLTPLGLFYAAEKYGSPVLNLGIPSVYCGGLCNAFPVASAPYWEWEVKFRAENNWKDLHGHKHKSFASGSYKSQLSSSDETMEAFDRFLYAHTDIFETVQNFQAIRSLFKIANANWNKGLTLTRDATSASDQEEESWLDIDWQEQPEQSIRSESETGAYVDPVDELMGNETSSPRLHRHSFRLLNKAFEIHDALVARGKDKTEDFPILRPINTFRYATEPSGEFALDTFDMTLYLPGNKRIALGGPGVPREQAEMNWQTHIVPLFSNPLLDFRFREKGDE